MFYHLGGADIHPALSVCMERTRTGRGCPRKARGKASSCDALFLIWAIEIKYSIVLIDRFWEL
jgi:hypothetical protein